MARVPQTGLTLSLDEAKNQLVDGKGNLIEFTEQKDGTFKSNDIEGDGYVYSYDLMPHPTLVTVYANKVKKEDASKKKSVNKEEEKALKDAQTVAENAPDKKTQKEAESVAKFGKRY